MRYSNRVTYEQSVYYPIHLYGFIVYYISQYNYNYFCWGNCYRMFINKKYLMMFLFLGLSTLTFVSGQEDTEVNVIKVKQGNPYLLIFPCVQNGAICPPVTICQATGFSPDQTSFFTNVTATNNGTYYNITRDGIHPLGLYRNEITCNNGTANGFDTVWIKITPTGDSRGFSLPIILGLGAFILLFTALFYRNPYFGIIAGFMFGMAGVYLVIYGLNDIADLYTRALGWVAIGLGVIFIIVGAYESAMEGKEDDSD